MELYLDGSGVVGATSRVCIGFMIPALPKTSMAAEVVAQPAQGSTPKKKQKIEKPPPVATHRIVVEPTEFKFPFGTFTYNIPLLEAIEVDEEECKTRNNGLPFRERTSFGEYPFTKQACDVVGKPSEPSFVTG